jgi:diguanylate cyclase (GGDEF)-like protein
MRLTAEATGLERLPQSVESVELEHADAALDASAQRERAIAIMLDEEYQISKERIRESLHDCSDELTKRLYGDLVDSNKEMRSVMSGMQAIVFAMLAIVGLLIGATVVLVLRPIAGYTRQIAQDRPLASSGALELRYLAEAYNTMYRDNHERTQHLQYAAQRDALTGLYNRGTYDASLAEHVDDVALMLVDVDYFKEVNDTHGHKVGDEVLRKMATNIERIFRKSDYACRVGGDEFAVIMTDMRPELRHVIQNKVRQLSEAMQDDSDGLPSCTVSAGVAFSTPDESERDLYHAADLALYEVKGSGRDGIAFYGDTSA